LAQTTPFTVPGLESGIARVAWGGAFSQGGIGTVASRHGCAVTTTGGVVCWGSNARGELGDGTTTGSATPVAVTGLGSGVVDVGVGGTLDGGSSCALTAAGAVLCWGNNNFGQLGNGTNALSTTPVAVSGLGSGVTNVSVGPDAACAVTTAPLTCWGFGDSGGIGDGAALHRNKPVAVSEP
jgi:alpha-tubulin suppressor-like RCC1 family protein